MPAQDQINLARVDKFGEFWIMRQQNHEILFRDIPHGGAQVLPSFFPIADAADFDARAVFDDPDRLIIQRGDSGLFSRGAGGFEKIFPIIMIAEHAEFAERRVNLR